MINAISPLFYRKLFLILTSLLVSIATTAVIITTQPMSAHASTSTCPPTLSYGSKDGTLNTVTPTYPSTFSPITKNPVHLLQQALNSAWYHSYDSFSPKKPYIIQLPIAEDGAFGPITEAAVVNYQYAHRDKLLVDGIVGPHTWNSLLHPGGCTPAPGNNGETGTSATCHPNISENSHDPVAITALQKLLNQKGAHLVIDGSFGPDTNAAVVAFQKSNGLTHNGEVGPDTWKALNSCSNGINEYGTSNITTTHKTTTTTTTSGSSSGSSSHSTSVTCPSDQEPQYADGKVIACKPDVTSPATGIDPTAYLYCKDGVQHANQSANCSQPNLDSEIACDYGFWYDHNELKFSSGAPYVYGNQQDAQQGADLACNSAYHN